MIGLVVVAIVSSVISHQKYLKRKKEIQERRQMM
jgi:heme exporter protein D